MSFQEKLKDTVSKGIEQSKQLFGTAKDKAKVLGDAGILRFEIRQLQDKIKKEEATLGHAAYTLLSIEGKQSISKKTPGIKESIESLDDLHTQVTAKRVVLADLEQKEEAGNEKEVSDSGIDEEPPK